MEFARSSEGSGMGRLLAIGSPLPPWQARVPAAGDAGSPRTTWTSPTETSPAATLDFSKPRDPAAEQQAMRHFISHIDAECFISLLQTMDPPPEDSRARAEYRRFYRELREVLEVPLLPLDPGPVGTPMAPVKQGFGYYPRAPQPYAEATPGP